MLKKVVVLAGAAGGVGRQKCRRRESCLVVGPGAQQYSHRGCQVYGLAVAQHASDVFVLTAKDQIACPGVA